MRHHLRRCAILLVPALLAVLLFGCGGGGIQIMDQFPDEPTTITEETTDPPEYYTDEPEETTYDTTPNETEAGPQATPAPTVAPPAGGQQAPPPPAATTTTTRPPAQNTQPPQQPPPPPPPAGNVTALRFDTTSPVSIPAGPTYQLRWTSTPANASVSFRSSNTNIATVDTAGRVIAMGQGNATITVSAGNRSDTVTVNVPAVPVTRVDIMPPTDGIRTRTDVRVGETLSLRAEPSGANGATASNRTVRWSSLDPSIATVDPNTGVVRGVNAGDAGSRLVIIVATAQDGSGIEGRAGIRVYA